jgi:hypothetical protein
MAAGSVSWLHGGLVERHGEVSGVARLSRRFAASFQLIVVAAPASSRQRRCGQPSRIHPFYQAASTLHVPAMVVAVTTLADGGGRVTVGDGGGGGGQRAAHCRGQCSAAPPQAAPEKKTQWVDARHRLIPGQPRALAAGAARG